jgi:plastocyanin
MNQTLFSAALTALIVLSFALSHDSQAMPVGGEQKGSGGKYQVKIDNFNFAPATLTVPAGTTVTWVNQDDVPYTVVSSEGRPSNRRFRIPTTRGSLTLFTMAGTCPYYCGIHPKMTGKVVVQ